MLIAIIITFLVTILCSRGIKRDSISRFTKSEIVFDRIASRFRFFITRLITNNLTIILTNLRLEILIVLSLLSIELIEVRTSWIR